MSSPPNKKKLEILIKKGHSPEISELLSNTIFGTRGKTRYHQKDIAERIASRSDIEFIQIKKDDRLYGTAGVIDRLTHSGHQFIKSYYVRYLSMWNPFRKQKGTINTTKKRSRSALRDRLGKTIMSHFEQPVIRADKSAVFYAFVESENHNSQELCKSLGFNPQRKTATLLYSRFFPKSWPNAELARVEDHTVVREKLKTFYRDYSFYFEDQLFEEGTYFVIKKDQKPVAGIRAIPVNWEIVEVPGLKGFLMQKVFPYLPLTCRLFDPKNLNFLTFDYFWFERGLEKHMYTLMNHAAHYHQIHTGMLWVDVESNLFSSITKSGKLGLLHKINGPVNADVMMRFINYTDKDRAELIQHPVFVSALDMS